MDSFPSAFHGFRVGPQRGRAAPPVATTRRPDGAEKEEMGGCVSVPWALPKAVTFQPRRAGAERVKALSPAAGEANGTVSPDNPDKGSFQHPETSSHARALFGCFLTTKVIGFNIVFVPQPPSCAHQPDEYLFAGQLQDIGVHVVYVFVYPLMNQLVALSTDRSENIREPIGVVSPQVP